MIRLKGQLATIIYDLWWRIKIRHRNDCYEKSTEKKRVRFNYQRAQNDIELESVQN